MVINCLIYQLLDLPGIIEGAKDGKGRGKQVITGEYTIAASFVGVTIMVPKVTARFDFSWSYTSAFF